MTLSGISQEEAEQNILSKFLGTFDCKQIIKDSIAWKLQDGNKIIRTLNRIEKDLAYGGLKDGKRPELIALRDKLKGTLTTDDPARIHNSKFDAWLVATGIRDESYDINIDRAQNKDRLNSLFIEADLPFTIHSERKKGYFLIRDRLEAAIYDLEHVHEEISTHIKNKAERLIALVDLIGDVYGDIGITDVVRAKIQSPLLSLIIRQETDTAEQTQINGEIKDILPVIEYNRQRILAEGEEQQMLT